jgi:hypothetical protein
VHLVRRRRCLLGKSNREYPSHTWPHDPKFFVFLARRNTFLGRLRSCLDFCLRQKARPDKHLADSSAQSYVLGEHAERVLRSSRQDCQSWRVEVSVASIARFGRLACPHRGEVTNCGVLGCASPRVTTCAFLRLALRSWHGLAATARVCFAGAPYHRHLARRRRGGDLFGDRQLCLDVLAGGWERFNWVVHSYCLMTNRYHLRVETPDGNPAKGKRKIPTDRDLREVPQAKRRPVPCTLAECARSYPNRGRLRERRLYHAGDRRLLWPALLPYQQDSPPRTRQRRGTIELRSCAE